MNTIKTSCALLLMSGLLGAAANSYAACDEVTVINHYGMPLVFNVSENAQLVFIDWKGINQFVLPDNLPLHSRLDFSKTSEGFIQVVPPAVYKKPGIDYLSVNSSCEASGFISEDIAYSWVGNTVIFCQPSAYNKNNNNCP